MSYGPISKLTRTTDGKLPSFAWPGGYPILYLDGHDTVLCAECANEADGDPDELDDFRPQQWFIYYEGPDYECGECGKMLESAYGDPEVEEV
jgi:hypothetical protein